MSKGLGLCEEGYLAGDLPRKCLDCGKFVCDYQWHRQKTGHRLESSAQYWTRLTEPKMAKIYVLTRFANQSSRCLGAFSTKEKAEEYIKQHASESQKSVDDYWASMQLDLEEVVIDE